MFSWFERMISLTRT